MQIAELDLTASRVVIEAFSNCYVNGAPHPNRILDFHDFIYMTDGEWDIIQNGVSFHAVTDDVVILSARQKHGGNLPCSNGTRTMYLHLSASENDDYSEAEKNSPDSGIVALPTLIHCREYPQIKSIFSELVSAFSANGSYREERLGALVDLLFINLHDANTKMNDSRYNSFVDRVLEVIHASPQLCFSNEKLSAMFFVSPKTLVERFKAKTGCSPHQYQQNYKLNIIKSQLIFNPKLTLYELAINYGFYDEFHLSRAFKKVYGISPREYKKKHLNDR